ncbi:MAG TPA: hypothetical protein VMU85_20215 [Stellaceae bacterium]|nr:hypothetical protein [Stellaceae bacterium]
MIIWNSCRRHGDERAVSRTWALTQLGDIAVFTMQISVYASRAVAIEAREERKNPMLSATLRKLRRRAMLICERDGTDRDLPDTVAGDAVVNGRPATGDRPLRI